MNRTLRLSYIDTAKCIAIFCIVMGHTTWTAREFLYSFHVQMFFICTGFVFIPKYGSIKEYLHNGLPNLIRRIYIPYILLILIFNLQLTPENLPWILWGSDQTVMHGKQFSFMWFLPTYFSAVLIWNFLFVFLSKFRNLKYTLPITVLFFGVLSCLSHNNANLSIDLFGKTFFLTGYEENPPPNFHYIGFPMNINVAGTAIVFIYVGIILRKVFDYLKLPENKKMSLTGLFLFGIIGFVCFKFNNTYFKPNEMYPYTIALSNGAYGNYPLFLSTSISISISLICLSCIIDSQMLAKIGRDTFGIYAMHPFVRSLIVFMIGGYGDFMFTVYGGVVMFVATLLFLPFVKRWFPFVIGERPIVKH